MSSRQEPVLISSQWRGSLTCSDVIANGGMRECRAAWPFGVSVREYRELEAGERWPDHVTWDRICKLYGWPQT